MEGNGRLGPALAFVDSVNQYPGATSRGHNGATLIEFMLNVTVHSIH